MKIAVVGIGVAGAYLMNMLSQNSDLHVIGFERLAESHHDAVCAWATCDTIMSEMTKNCGLNFDNYVLHKGKQMAVDLQNESDKNKSISLKLMGMVSYDKLQLIKDMIKGTKINFGKIPLKKDLEDEFDLIIDSTGFHRSFLPRIKNDTWIPCVQYKVRYNESNVPFSDFYLKAFPSMTGYFWYFPLGNGYAHIGAGDFKRKHTLDFVEKFLSKYKCDVIKKVGRPVRITPPLESQPFTDGRKTVGVGESIGTVYPLLGEGIIPSTWCADLLVKNIFDIDAYTMNVLESFKIYLLVYKFIQSKINGSFSLIRNCFDLISIYKHMKSNESRYGMKVNLLDMLKVSKI